MSLKKLDVSRTSTSSRRIPTWNVSDLDREPYNLVSRFPWNFETAVSEEKHLGLFPLMTPLPTRFQWVRFFAQLTNHTRVDSEEATKTYYEHFTRRRISDFGADTELNNKEITHYMMQYAAHVGLLLGKAITVMNLARLSGVLYSEDVAATFRFSTFNVLLRPLEGTPMPSWLYDSLIKAAANFVNLDSDSGLTVILPYFMNPEDAWMDLPHLLNSEAHPVGGITKRPPTVSEYSSNGEFGASGINASGTPRAHTLTEVMEPKAMYSSMVSGLKASVVRNNDTFLDYLLLELSSAVTALRSRFGTNEEAKLNIIGPTGYHDTVEYWNELGFLDGEFEVKRFMDDVNAIPLYDYSALRDARQRNTQYTAAGVPLRNPASLQLNGATRIDYTRPSHTLLRAFDFDATEESYPGEKRIAFEYDLDQYLDLTESQWITNGYVAALPEEIPYVGLKVEDDIDAIKDFISKGELSTTYTMYNCTDPGLAGQNGFVSEFVFGLMSRLFSNTYAVFKDEERDKLLDWVKQSDNFYLPSALLNRGVFCPIPKKMSYFNPADPYQQGEYVVLNLKDTFRKNSWELAFSKSQPTCDEINQQIVMGNTYIIQRHQTRDGGDADATAYLQATDGLASWNMVDSKIKDFIGLTWAFLGDAITSAPGNHLRRSEIVFPNSYSAAGEEDVISAGTPSICWFPFKTHSDWAVIDSMSFSAYSGALVGLTISADGEEIAFTFDPTTSGFGYVDPTVIEYDRSTDAELFLIPGSVLQRDYPVHSAIQKAHRALEKHNVRLEPNFAAIKDMPELWVSPVAPDVDMVIQRGIISFRRQGNLKAENSRKGRGKREPYFRKDARTPRDAMDKEATP